MTLGHEAFVHADKDADRRNAIDENLEGEKYTKDKASYYKDIQDVGNSAKEDHEDLQNGEVKKFEIYSQELRTKNNDQYYNTKYDRQKKQPRYD